MFDRNLISTVSSPLQPTGTGDKGLGIIVFEMNIYDYSMAQIARIVEDNDAKIWSSHVTSTVGSVKIDVTLKINRTDLTSIIQSFRRYGYTIKTSFQSINRNEDVLRNHYDQLMLYLNV